MIRFVAQHFLELAKKHYPTHLLQAIEKLEFPVSIQGFLNKLSNSSTLDLETSFASIKLDDRIDYIKKWQSAGLFKKDYFF